LRDLDRYRQGEGGVTGAPLLHLRSDPYEFIRGPMRARALLEEIEIVPLDNNDRELSSGELRSRGEKVEISLQALLPSRRCSSRQKMSSQS